MGYPWAKDDELFAVDLNAEFDAINAKATSAQNIAITAQNTANAALPLAGGTMVGDLTLNGEPTDDLHAATKHYVDSHSGGGFVPLSGGTMTGALVLSGDPSDNLGAATKQYVDAIVANEPVNVMHAPFNAKGDGTTDDTAAFQAALDTGRTVYLPRPSASYRLRDALNCVTPGQVIYGDGKAATIITIDSTFNMTALGVFAVTFATAPTAPGPQFRDFQVNFAQPDTAMLSALTTYPPAFYAQNQARTVWRGIKVNAATNAIDMRQNAGGSSIIDCELCAFENHVLIDGTADSITIQNTRFENDLLTANQSVIYRSHAVGVSSGRCDDLHINGCLFICYTDLKLFQGASGNTFGEVTNTDFDTTVGMTISAGTLQVSGSMFSVSAASNTAIVISGGYLTLSSCWFIAGAPLTNGLVLASPSAGQNVVVQFNGCRFDSNGDMFAIQGFGFNGNCELMLNGCRFGLDGSIARTKATVVINDGSLLTMSGCRFSARGAGSGHVLETATDASHNVCGNSFGGWDAIMFAGSSHVFANNN
jgi:hypothetical protein